MTQPGEFIFDVARATVGFLVICELIGCDKVGYADPGIRDQIDDVLAARLRCEASAPPKHSHKSLKGVPQTLMDQRCNARRERQRLAERGERELDRLREPEACLVRKPK